MTTIAAATLLVIAAATAGAVAGFLLNHILDNRWMAEFQEIFEEERARTKEQHNKEIKRLTEYIAKLETQKTEIARKQPEPVRREPQKKEKWLIALEDLNWEPDGDNIDFGGF